jgi:ribosomal protein S18 acetylase RimI-like enzyme
MEVRTLESVDIHEVIDCFLKAFEGYYVAFPTDHDFYLDRWESAGVKLDFSYGAFEDGELIAFLIHAIDYRAGQVIAFNTGTGVLPEFRGRRIVAAMYEFAIPDLKMKGITYTLLEVIQQNEKAVSVYKNVGFEIRREFQCFKRQSKSPGQSTIEVNEADMTDWDWSVSSVEAAYSWDNQEETLVFTDCQGFIVSANNAMVAYFVFIPETNQVAQFGVIESTHESWDALFEGMSLVSDEIKINNVDMSISERILQLNLHHFQETVKQFEMGIEL